MGVSPLLQRLRAYAAKEKLGEPYALLDWDEFRSVLALVEAAQRLVVAHENFMDAPLSQREYEARLSAWHDASSGIRAALVPFAGSAPEEKK